MKAYLNKFSPAGKHSQRSLSRMNAERKAFTYGDIVWTSLRGAYSVYTVYMQCTYILDMAQTSLTSNVSKQRHSWLDTSWVYAICYYTMLRAYDCWLTNFNRKFFMSMLRLYFQLIYQQIKLFHSILEPAMISIVQEPLEYCLKLLSGW